MLCKTAIETTDIDANLYLRDVFFKGFISSVLLEQDKNNTAPIPVSDPDSWIHVGEFAVGHNNATTVNHQRNNEIS